ncbi:hypothetical protein DMB37_33520 [Nocardia sp. CS682]|nr:hypothetical protein DMB37_33520 [Nocardia sp. CS682]
MAIVVEDLAAAVAFFIELGLELEAKQQSAVRLPPRSRGHHHRAGRGTPIGDRNPAEVTDVAPRHNERGHVVARSRAAIIRTCVRTNPLRSRSGRWRVRWLGCAGWMFRGLPRMSWWSCWSGWSRGLGCWRGLFRGWLIGCGSCGMRCRGL